MIRIAIAFLLLTASAYPQSRTAPSPHESLRLSEVVERTLAHQPSLEEVRHRIAAANHRIPQVTAWADPSVSVGWMGSAIPFKTQSMDPSSYRAIGVMQMIPTNGKLRLEGEIARKESEAVTTELNTVERQLVAEAKTTFYDYYYFGKALEIMRRDKDILAEIAEIAESRYSVGKGTQAETLRAQTELLLMLQKIDQLTAQQQMATARLNTLMGEDPAALLPLPEEIKQDALPSEAIADQASMTGDTRLALGQKMIERSRTTVELARRQFRPDFSVGYMYQQRSGMPDMHGVTFAVSIPLFYKTKQQEAVREAEEQVLAAQKSHDARGREVRGELRQQILQARLAASQIELYEKAILPQSELALESSRAAYSTGGVDMMTVLSSFTTLHGYQIDRVRQLADYQTALARIEFYTGNQTAQADKGGRQ